MGAGVASARRATGRTTGILEKAAGRKSLHSAAADRSAPAAGAELSWRHSARKLFDSATRRIEIVEPARGRDSLHGDDRGLCRAPVPLFVLSGCKHWNGELGA